MIDNRNRISPINEYYYENTSAKDKYIWLFYVVIAIGIVSLLWYITTVMFKAVSSEILELAATIFVLGISVGFVVSFCSLLLLIVIRISKPGVQAKGILGRVEEKIGLG